MSSQPAVVQGPAPAIASAASGPGPGEPSTPRVLSEKDILCLGHLQKVFALLEKLHEVGCERDHAGNRRLFFDDYCKLLLLYLWNPLIESVQDLQQVLSLPKVAQRLGVRRFSTGSFSESVRVFDPEQLKPLIAELAGQLTPGPLDPRLGELKQVLTLVDGTVLRGLSRLVHAAVGQEGRYSTSRDGQGVYGWRLHLQLDLQTFSPHRLERTGARNAGEQRENQVLRRSLEPGRCYVGDGGYADSTLFEAIEALGSSFVIRTREDAAGQVVQDLPLSPEAQEAGVVRDTRVRLLDRQGQPTGSLWRRVELKVAPHPHRTRAGMKTTDRLVLYSNLRELPAELIGLIYRYRYTVELFFRTYKQLLGLRHLLNQHEEGVDLQIYCSVIVCLLIQLLSGQRPTKAMRNLVGWYLLGLASAQEVSDFLDKPDRTGVKLRAKAELWKKWGV